MKPVIEKCKYILAIFFLFLIFFGTYLQGYADVTPVSERTPQVRDAIVATVPGVDAAADVTEAHLAAITTLNMREKNIATLKADDFEGLTALSDLNLYGNQLSRLPDRIFERLTALTVLRLGGNAVEPLPIPVALEKGVEGQFKAVAPTGATFDYVLSITVTNGSIIGGATTVSIPQGRVESEPVTVRRTPGTTGEVTVAIQALPRLPSAHYGYALVRSDPLPLSVITGSNTAPVFIEGRSTTRSVAENTVTGTDIGAAIAATDAENDALTYTLSGADASAFAIDPATGQLKTKASLDYETQNALTVIITASDGSFTNTITVRINVTDIEEVVVVNTAPSFYEGESTTRVVFENTAVGLNIGAPVLATDSTDDFLRYTLGGVHADAFAIDSATGQLKTKASLDYETQRIYTVTITVDDEELSDTIRVIIGVIDVNDTIMSAGFVPVIERTPEVRDAIVAVVPNATDAATVTEAEVAAITTLNLRNRGISFLKTGDFSGMTALRNLNLYANHLNSLPTGIFTGLPALTQLRLGGNQIDPLPLMVSLQSVGPGEFKAVMPTGAPFTIVLPIGVTTGSIRGGVRSVMIPQGSMESRVFTAVGTGTAPPKVAFRGFPGLPMGHYGYTLAQSTVCNRTEQVAAAIAEAVGVDDCSRVSEIDLATITSLNLSKAAITSLKAGDFDGMLSLITLSLDGNNLTRLPMGLFDDLVSLRELHLNANQLVTLPTGVFESLSALETIHLQENALTDLPDHLFDGTPFLRSLLLSHNHLTSLPAGIFQGLTQLHQLHLRWNPNAASQLPLDVALEKVGTHQFTAVMPSGAPFEIVLPIKVANGTSVEGATAIIIPKGSVESRPMTLARTPNTIAAVTADIETPLPMHPTTHNGYVLVKSATGPLEVIEQINVPPVFTDGANTSRTIAENVAIGTNVGNPVPATDANKGAILTYSLEDGADADAFDIDSETGQLKTKASLDFETQKTYAVTLSVSDGMLTDTIAVTVNISDVNEAPVFAADSLTTRTVAENTPSGENIGNAYSATDVDADTLTYSLDDGADADAFDIDTETGQLKTKASLDFETQKTYAVRLSVSDGTLTDTIALTINVSNVNEAPVFAADSLTTHTVAENTPSGENIGTPYSATDVDADTLTYSLDDGADADAFDMDSETGQLKTKASLDFETQKTYAVRLSVSDGKLTDTLVVTINVSNVNEAPVFAVDSLTTYAVAENTPSGENIGPIYSTRDVDGDVLTYSLDGTDADAFDMDSETGQLKTKASLDFETKKAYSVTLTVSDGEHTDTITVRIDVTDVDENRAPVFTEGNSTTRSVQENIYWRSNIGSAIGATDPDNDDLTYSLNGTDADSFSIVSTSGQLKTQAILDYERKSSYSVTVSVSDGKGGSDSITVTINVIDVYEGPTNRAPVFADGEKTIRAVEENTASDQDIGTPVSATDVNRKDTLTYTLSGTDASVFSIVSTTGQLKTKAPLDYETKDSYSVTVSVSDGKGGYDSIAVTINVTDDPEIIHTPISDRTLQVQTAIVAAIAGVDSPTAVTATHLRSITVFNLADTGVTSLKLNDFDGLTGLETLDLSHNRLTALPAGIFDKLTGLRELDLSHNAISDVSALQGLTWLEHLYVAGNPISDYASLRSLLAANPNISIDIDITNNPPQFSEDSRLRSIAENTASGINIGAAFSVTDGDSDPLTYSLGGTDAASFSIDSTTGQLQTKAPLDFETKDSYSVTVSVSDGHLTDSITVTIRVTNANEAPSFTEGSSTTRSIRENTRPGVHIGSAVAATDTDGDTLTYSLGGTDAEAFDIDSTTGQLQTRAPLNYETKSSYSVTVSVSDGSLTDSITVTISVTDVYEAPPNRAPVFEDDTSTTYSVLKNTGPGENIGNPVTARDPEGSPVTYSLSGTNAASFSIESATGQLQISELLLYAQTPYSVTIIASDNRGARGRITVTINVLKPVADRTEQVKTAIVAAISGVTSAADVTKANLGEITSLNLMRKSIVSLMPGDFDGLTELTQLYLRDNTGLTTLPAGIFDHLTALAILFLDRNKLTMLPAGIFDKNTQLTQLYLFNNDLSSLPADIFNHLTELTHLYLSGNDLTTLPAGIFDKNTQVTHLHLHSNDLSSLPAGIFDKNTQVTSFYMNSNDLTSLPAGIFDHLTALKTLYLSGNDLTSLPPKIFDENIHTQLETLGLTGNNITDMTGLSALAPMGMTQLLYLFVSGNPISDYAPLQVHKTAIEAGPASLSMDLTNKPPVFTDGESTTRSVAENTAADTNIGAVVAATDADSDTLTYRLDGTDAASFKVVAGTGGGQLQTKDLLDYETKNSYTVTVTAYDGNSGGDRITVTINVTDAANAPPSVQTPPLPDTTALLSNFPNPFNPETWIPYQLATPADVTLTIYDIRGVVVRELKLGHQAAGLYRSRSRAIHWDGRNLLGEKVATGLYFYTLKAGDYAATRKLLIRK